MCELRVDAKGTLIITGALDMANIEMLHDGLTGAFDNGTCTVVDLTGVTEVSTPALQILAAFSKSLADVNRPVEYLAGPAIIEALKLSGLKRLVKVA